MKLIRTQEAKPGQKAARDVADMKGNILYKAGTVFTPDQLAQCRVRNIFHLFVEDEAVAVQTSAETAGQREQVAKDLDQLFVGTEASPVMTALREAAKKYLSSKIQ